MPLRKDGTERMRPSTEKIYLQIVQAYVNGRTMKEIAAKGHLHYETVRGAFVQMRRKYKAGTTAELIGILFRKGLLK